MCGPATSPGSCGSATAVSAKSWAGEGLGAAPGSHPASFRHWPWVSSPETWLKVEDASGRGSCPTGGIWRAASFGEGSQVVAAAPGARVEQGHPALARLQGDGDASSSRVIWTGGLEK